MENEGVIKAACPSCGMEVTIKKELLSKRIKCPQCKLPQHFEAVVTPEEAFRRGTAAALKGAKRFGIFAGAMLKKAAIAGMEKYKDHAKRAKALEDLQKRLLNHLLTERPSLGTLVELESESQLLGTTLAALTAERKADLAAFFARELGRARMAAAMDAESEQTIRHYMKSFAVPPEMQVELDKTLTILRFVHDIRTDNVKPLAEVEGLVVRSNEAVWYQSDASLIVRVRSGYETLHEGRLFVTSMRVVFTSRTYPDEMQLGAINSVELDNGRLLLTGSGQKTASEFLVSVPEVAMEHVRHALRMFHGQTQEPQ